ncbi:hypothetical protein [Synechococcus sp. F70.1]|uniref:hypothetical protein n=1 Tax=Synechococcus sp. F70.1 TaxID=2964532 RepID=UPI0039C62624
MVRPLLLLGILLGLAGGMSLAPALANAQAVWDAELALQPLLPPGSRILRSRRLNNTEAEVWVEFRGNSNPVIMRLNPSGRWEQDMNATLARGANQLQALARQQTAALPEGFGQTAPDQPRPLPTQPASILIPPVDREQETQRALSRAGRADPFVPQNVRAPEPSLPPLDLPPLPELPPLEGEVPVGVATPLSTPTPDPAAFARSVQVSGVIQIGRESFALISAPGTLPAVVQAGQNYQTAQVAKVSVPERQVVLSEGGETVVKTMQNTTVIVGAP